MLEGSLAVLFWFRRPRKCLLGNVIIFPLSQLGPAGMRIEGHNPGTAGHSRMKLKPF